MGTFMADGAAVLPVVKSDLRPATVPPTATEWASADANQVRTALLDLRTQVLAGAAGGTEVVPVLGTATPNSSTTSMALIVVDAGGLTVIANPTGTPVLGQELVLTIQNDSGSSQSWIYGALYKLASYSGALDVAKSRSISLRWNGVSWLEVSRSADITH